MEQVYKGDNITFSFTRNIICPYCEGYGTSNPSSMKPCTACEGKGFTFAMVEVRNGFREKVEQICNQCGGVGKLPGKKCHYCKGSKVIPDLETMTVQLIKGLLNGNKVILRNMGG
jgi:DnaJ-class molecular chaperone